MKTQKLTTPRTFHKTFKPQFAKLVEAGIKLQTVRPIPKRMPAAGDRITLREWQGAPRRSKQRIMAVGTIAAVRPVEIAADSITINGTRLDGPELERFAVADGFGDWQELREWFAVTHKELPFTGILIQWRKEATK